MTFTENSKYLLEQSIFNRHTLLCTYVDNTTAYLKIAGQDTLTDYRYELKWKRLYKWSGQYQVWDRLEEYSLTEIADVMSKYKPEDVTISYGFIGD